jgi:hypothetical protein
MKKILALCALLLGGVSISYATVITVQISTSTAIENQFITATEQQFNVTVATNPYFPNTYTINLVGLNSNYNPPPTNAQLLNDLVTVDSYTFTYGFADGMTYQQTQEEGLIGGQGDLCAYPTSYTLVETSTATFSKNTCYDVINTLEQEIFEMSLSTPSVIPSEP